MDVNSTKMFKLPSWALLHAGYATVGKEWNFKDVSSPFARLYLVTHGSGRLLLNDHIIPLRPGFIYLIPPYAVHTYFCDECLSHYYLHVYETDCVLADNTLALWKFPDELPVMYGELETFKTIMAYNPDKALSNINPEAYTTDKMLEISIDRYYESKFHNKILTSSLIGVILARWFEKGEFRSSGLHPDISHVVDVITRNPAMHFTLSGLADMTSMSEGHFSRMFRHQVGKTPIEFIHERRMNIARARLLSEPTPIKIIAYELGYDDNNYFSRLFRRLTGMTPGQYRSMRQ